MKNMIPLATIKGDTPDETRLTLTYDVVGRTLFAEGEGVPTHEVGPRFNSIEDAVEYIQASYGAGGVWELEWIERDEMSETKCACCSSVAEHIRQHYDPDGLTKPTESAESVLAIFTASFPGCDLTVADVQGYLDALRNEGE